MIHHGIVLDTGKDWDSGGVAFCSLYRDPEGEVRLFYTGSREHALSRSEIGVARSSKTLEFVRKKAPILGDRRNSFCEARALTPAVTRVGGRYYMLLAGRPDDRSALRLGMACSDDLEAPWKILGVVKEPDSPWEEAGVDAGPGVVELDERTRLFFYSNVTPLSILSGRGMRRYVERGFRRNYVRRIAFLKVRINGPSLADIEVYKGDFPLSHLNGALGSWRESLFCPGYMSLGSNHYLFTTCSNYSMGSPFHQSVAFVRSTSAYFDEQSVGNLTKMIDGVDERRNILKHSIRSLALDTPCPFVDGSRLVIYYSVMDRDEGIWRIAASSTCLEELSGTERTV